MFGEDAVVAAVRIRLMVLDTPQVLVRRAIEEISGGEALDAIATATLNPRARMVAMACRLFHSKVGWAG